MLAARRSPMSDSVAPSGSSPPRSRFAACSATPRTCAPRPRAARATACSSSATTRGNNSQVLLQPQSVPASASTVILVTLSESRERLGVVTEDDRFQGFRDRHLPGIVFSQSLPGPPLAERYALCVTQSYP